MVVEQIAAAIPNFDPKEFLKEYTEVDPVTVCRLVDHVAAVEAAPAIEDLEAALRREFYAKIQKYPTKSDWRELCWLSYDSYVDDLLEAYQRNGKLSDQEAEAITARRDEFYQAILSDELRLIEATWAVDNSNIPANNPEGNIIDDSCKVSVDDNGEVIADDPDHIPIEEVFENMQLFDLITLFPQIYDSVETDKIYQGIKETLQRIPDEAIENIIMLKKQGDMQGSDRLLVDTLREAFGIEHEINIQYLEPDSMVEGSYSEAENTLYMKRNLNGIDDEFDVMQTIAHEMCHAYQYAQVKSNTNRGREYDINFRWYVNNIDSLDYYNRQLVEMEAFAFEEYFGEFVRVHDVEAFNNNYK